MERFKLEKLGERELNELKELGRICRGDILKMTTLAGCGHPGGSMSSIDFYLVVYKYAGVNPKMAHDPERDRVVVSHGHTSPGVYAALGRLGFFDVNTAIAGFRGMGSPFEGHVERCVPGIEWSSGNLGQGLSAGCGFALAARLTKKDYHVYTLMGDGEHAKGQISEARRFARKYELTNLTVIIDYNRLQISGDLSKVMPQNIKEGYLSDGWDVVEIDGHDCQAIYQALRKTTLTRNKPTAIIANTIMGKGVSFMEDKYEFHGKALSQDQYKKALDELKIEDDLARHQERRKQIKVAIHKEVEPDYLKNKVTIETGVPRTYKKDEKTDNRSGFGNALKDIGVANYGKDGRTPVAVLDCDLAVSVKTDGFAAACPEWFFEVGIQEHHAAAMAGALSISGVLTFFADFGVFGIDETYNQHRLNDINLTNLKLVTTHCGLDVGEDGKTHQCLDYVGLFNNMFGYKIIIPGDPNQTDRATRYAASNPGNFLLAMGRSKLSPIVKEDGSPFFGESYKFEYGKADILREGKDAAIIAIGAMVYRAVEAREILSKKGIHVKLINVSSPLQLDKEVIRSAAKTGLIVTYEDHNVKTGLGSMVANLIAEEGLRCRLHKLGVANYAGSGTPDELYQVNCLDVPSLVKTVEEGLKAK